MLADRVRNTNFVPIPMHNLYRYTRLPAFGEMYLRYLHVNAYEMIYYRKSVSGLDFSVFYCCCFTT